jgi:periplasmic protein TonB
VSSKKVFDLDRPHEASVDLHRADGQPDIAARLEPGNELDTLVSHFLEQVNSLTAEFESRHETTTEQIDALLTDLESPSQDTGDIVNRPPAATTRSQSSLTDSDSQTGAAVRQPSSPMPVSRPNAELDGAFGTMDELEDLPAPARTARAAAQVAVASVGAEFSEAPETATATFSAEEATAELFRSSILEPVAPAALDVEEFYRPPWVKPLPEPRDTNKIVIRVTLAAVLVIVPVVIYLLAKPFPKLQTAESRLSALPAGGGNAGITAGKNTDAAIAITPSPAAAHPAPGVQERSSRQPARSQRLARSSLDAPRGRGAADSSGQRNAPIQSARSTDPVASTVPTLTEIHPPTKGVEVAPAAGAQPIASGPVPQPVVPEPEPATSAQQANAGDPGSWPTSTGPTSLAPISIPAAPPAPARPEPSTAPASPTSAKPSPASLPAPSTPSVSMAVLISRVLPTYPEAARSRHLSGRVDLDIQIDAQGQVVDVKAVSGPPIFHAAAEDAVRKWRYKPATLGSDNVASTGKVTVVFNYQK